MKARHFLITGILLTSVLCFLVYPLGLVGAQAVDKSALIAQLLAEIQILQERLQVLQAQQRATSNWCHDFNTNLRFGDSGSGITSLIEALTYENLFTYNTGAPITGTQFDESVLSAVISFQEKYTSAVLAPYGLTKGTGFVGPTTRAKLNAIYGCAFAI